MELPQEVVIEIQFETMYENTLKTRKSIIVLDHLINVMQYFVK